MIVLIMELFHPSVFLAMFPYLFISSFPIFGLILVTKWIANDTKKKRRPFWEFSNRTQIPLYVEGMTSLSILQQRLKIYIIQWNIISTLNAFQKKCALCEDRLPATSSLNICDNCLKNADCCVGLEKLRD